MKYIFKKLIRGLILFSLVGFWLIANSACGKKGVGSAAPNAGFTTPPPPPPTPGVNCITAHVSWTPPDKMIDGSPIPAGYLVGYRLYRGLSSGAYSDEYVILDGAANYYEVPNLSKGLPHYFAIKAQASNGELSAYSNEYAFIGDNCGTVIIGVK